MTPKGRCTHGEPIAAHVNDMADIHLLRTFLAVYRAGTFTRADDYHQRYLEKRGGGYPCHYLRD